ncbi:MAG: response regulator [Lewinellaceae bacterium]|nr:response regulator [Lewinellaceae bacterium]
MAGVGRHNVGFGNYLNSRNFKRQALIATGGKLIAVEVKNNLPVKTAVKGWASRAMGELDHNRVLVTSESGNKSILDLSTMQSSEIKRVSDNPWSKVRNYGQLVQRPGQLWCPLEGKRLACYQQSSRTFQYYDVGQEFDKFNFIQPREIALVNTANELYRYQLDQAQLRPVLNGGAPLQLGGTANELQVDNSGILWIASLNGLWRVDPSTGDSKRLGKDTGLVDDRIMCINQAENGELWLGTLGSGVQIYNPKTGALRVLDQSMGLSNNSVVGILADAGGDRWISTFDGITVVSSDGKVLFELTEIDGLAHREFNRHSYLKTSDGMLLFGGVNGVTLMEPQKVKALLTQTDLLRIYLTDIAYFDWFADSEVHRTNGFNQLERVVLPASHRFIKLDFGLSDYSAPEQCSFAYRLLHDNENNPDHEGDAIWTNIGSSSELLLNDLPVGSYTILIRGMNANGQLTETPLAIPVRVQEFFYKTWWFYLLCALPFLLGAYFWIRRLHTERERLEAEVTNRTQQILRDKALIEEQAAKLQELDELKSRFFTNISHEFRTPLTVISGMATQIRQQPGQWLEKGMELIQRNSQQLLSLINQILDLRKLESGALAANLVRGNIVPYLRYIAESFVQLAQTKGLRIHVLANADTVDMDYDPEKMMHILSNLLSNAVKYTPAPGDIYLQIDRRHSETGREHLLVQVKDSGQGISAEALPHIFELFYQVEDLATQKPQGSGVGLALTKELVQLLNGTIEVSSKPGEGTRFLLSFPITREAKIQEGQYIPTVENTAHTGIAPEIAKTQAAPATQASSTGSGQADSGKPSLLIVEDNADVRLYLSACLEPYYQLLLVKDGQEGIDLAIEAVPDLIVSDVMMPVKDGFALCEALKNDERTSHIPIVLLTAKADFESRLSGLRRGADAYLTKPFEQEELLVRLEQLLVLRTKLQERYRNPSFAESPADSEAVQAEDALF